jgi:hypothetical protein
MSFYHHFNHPDVVVCLNSNIGIHEVDRHPENKTVQTSLSVQNPTSFAVEYGSLKGLGN